MTAEYNKGKDIVANTMYRVLPPLYDSFDARVLLIAIGAQESLFQYQQQANNGPANGYWMFESKGGVKGVLEHHSTRRMAIAVCKMRGIYPHIETVHRALISDPLLACAFARLLLWTDPDPLPHNDAHKSWEYYLRIWRPGKPHPIPWLEHYAEAQRMAT